MKEEPTKFGRQADPAPLLRTCQRRPVDPRHVQSAPKPTPAIRSRRGHPRSCRPTEAGEDSCVAATAGGTPARLADHVLISAPASTRSSRVNVFMFWDDPFSLQRTIGCGSQLRRSIALSVRTSSRERHEAARERWPRTGWEPQSRRSIVLFLRTRR